MIIWIAFRLWKYVLLLAERHRDRSGKLPLIAPIVVYSGSRKYSAPRNLWELFADPAKAKELLAGNYRLVDLQAMPEDEIVRKKI